MKELIEMILQYPLWMRIVVVVLVFIIVILLVVFKPVKESQSADFKTLETIVSGRFDSIQINIDAVYAKLNATIDKNNRDQVDNLANFKRHADRAKELHKQVLGSLKDGNLVLFAELSKQVRDELAEVDKYANAVVGGVGSGWYQSLPRAYIDRPTREQDPEYAAVQDAIGSLRRATTDKTANMTYPGDLSYTANPNVSDHQSSAH